jgi:hypothetical protein
VIITSFGRVGVSECPSTDKWSEPSDSELKLVVTAPFVRSVSASEPSRYDPKVWPEHIEKNLAIITLTKVTPMVDGARQAGGQGKKQSLAEKGPLRDAVVAAVLAELDDYIDPPMVTGLTVPQSDRLWIARSRSATSVGPVWPHRPWHLLTSDASLQKDSASASRSLIRYT